MPSVETIVVLIFGGVVLGILVPLALWYPEWRRRKALRALAERLGMAFAPNGRAIRRRYHYLHLMRRSRRALASNVLMGTFQGHPAVAFDFYPNGRAMFGYDGNRQYPAFTVFLLEHEGEFPELRIYPEDIGSKLAQMLGYEDIDFESVEFSDAFCVRSPDRKFAYDVCHPRMMDYLLRHRELTLEFARDCITLRVDVYPPKRHAVEAIPARLMQLVEIRNLLPKYLFEER